MNLIIDERMRSIEKEKLKELGYKLIEITRSEKVYQEISSHVDIFTCKIGNKLIVEPTQYDNIKRQMQHQEIIVLGKETIETKYPFDIKYNVCIIGNKMVGARVNDKITPIGYELQNGDVVEIITSPTSKGPSRDWLNIAKSPNAKAKMMQFFRKEKYEENVEQGKETLNTSASTTTTSTCLKVSMWSPTVCPTTLT